MIKFIWSTIRNYLTALVLGDWSHPPEGFEEGEPQISFIHAPISAARVPPGDTTPLPEEAALAREVAPPPPPIPAEYVAPIVCIRCRQEFPREQVGLVGNSVFFAVCGGCVMARGMTRKEEIA